LDFLRNLAAQFGIPFDTPQNDVDFVPSVDVFDTPAKYILHVSLPGAKKDDLSIDYDADESVLRLAGVVYRPGINEELHQALVMEERAREVGVFEREVRLGTREAPAVVSVDEITAKLEEGVLTVILPKIEAEPEPKKKVFVEDGDAEEEKDATDVDEASVTMTPEGSDEEETREYVKVPVL
jgi:HSP20 family protein